MSNQPTPSHGVMEGNGAYNAHARLQAGGATLALPLLEDAARKIKSDSADQPIVIADYGSSQGKNSLVPIRLAVATLRARFGPERPIFVFHIDLPANDFNALFNVLDADPQRYELAGPQIFPCAIGRSFYRNVLPCTSVDLGWSSYAAVWLSRIPMPIHGHFVVIRSTAAVRAEFDCQAAQDWERFLSLRASELRHGGRLVIVLPGLDDDGLSGFEDLFDHANAVLIALVDDGVIRAEERARMVLGAYPRRRCDLLAPFKQGGQFQSLTVKLCENSVLKDPVWTDYERHGNKEILAGKHALFFRSTFLPSLAEALSPDRSHAERCAFANRLEHGLRERLASHPVPLNSFAQTIVLAKI
jgi:SAM dependent carboxyl methyltransferase